MEEFFFFFFFILNELKLEIVNRWNDLLEDLLETVLNIGFAREREREREASQRVTQLVFIATKPGIYQCERHWRGPCHGLHFRVSACYLVSRRIYKRQTTDSALIFSKTRQRASLMQLSFIQKMRKSARISFNDFFWEAKKKRKFLSILENYRKGIFLKGDLPIYVLSGSLDLENIKKQTSFIA